MKPIMKPHVLNKYVYMLIISMLLLFTASCSDTVGSGETPDNPQGQTVTAPADPTGESRNTYDIPDNIADNISDYIPGNTPSGSVREKGTGKDDQPAQESAVPARKDRLLVFSDADIKRGLDKTLKYTEEDLALIEEADNMFNKGNYSEANKLYDTLAKRNAAFQRDPLLLINWSLACLNLDMYLEAQAKLEEAAEVVKNHNELKKRVLETIDIFIRKVPDGNEYESRKLYLLRMAYNLDSNNIGYAFSYANAGLDYMLGNSRSGIQTDQLEHYFGILENIRKKDWRSSIKAMDLSACYTKIASLYLTAYDARGYLDIIRKCAENALAIEGENTKNPSLFYLLGIIRQAEGNMEEAVRLMRHAAGIAPNNKDIDMWLKAYDPSVSTSPRIIKIIPHDSISPETVAFDTYAGTMWLDNDKVLTTVFVPGDNSQLQRLILLDTGTLAFEEIYEGELLNLRFVTPDKQFVVLHDNTKGLMLVNLNTKRAKILGGKGYHCSLSPDGNTIAFSDEGIWLYNIKEGTKQKISEGKYDYSPIWHPDGNNILFIGDLGGEDLGNGAGRLQSIFIMPVDDPSAREMIVDGWEDKFRFIEWVVPGEIVHVEQGWDDGFESILLDLYDGSRNPVSSMERGEMLYYSSKASNLYIYDGYGMVKRIDPFGNIMSMHSFGDIWGDSLGVFLSDIMVLPFDSGVVFLYGNRLLDNLTIWMAGINFDEPVLLGEVPRDSGSGIIVSPQADKLLCGCKQTELEIYSLSQEEIMQMEILQEENLQEDISGDMSGDTNVDTNEN